MGTITGFLVGKAIVAFRSVPRSKAYVGLESHVVPITAVVAAIEAKC